MDADDRLTRARPSGRPEVQSYVVAPPPPLPSVEYGPPEPIIFVPEPEVVYVTLPAPLPDVIILPRFSPGVFGVGAAAGVLIDLAARLVF